MIVADRLSVPLLVPPRERLFTRIREFSRNTSDTRANDLALSVAQTDVKGDRSKPPLEQEHPDYYLRIVGDQRQQLPCGMWSRGKR